MSFRVRDYTHIHNNPQNLSVSKQQYSIPKAHRFRDSKSETGNYKYYDLPSTNKYKAPTFGVSDRQSIFNVDKSIPPPTKYSVKDMAATQTISFAKGRYQCKINNFLKVNNNPGPGSYNPNPEFIDPLSPLKYSIRAKTEGSLRVDVQIPGPGKYKLKDSWLEKDKILSTERKYGCPLIKNSKNLDKIEIKPPALDCPIYNPKTNYKGEETFNKTGGFSIGRSRRFIQKMKTEVPGPGSYQCFSEF